jgi:hypothetical protein
MIQPIEILLGFADNIHGGFVVLFVLASIALVGAGIALIVTHDEHGCDDNDRKVSRLVFTFVFPSWIIISLIAAMPTVDDLWKVRIGLLKLQLASPENVQKGAEEIARIAKQLECSYFKCQSEDKK